jgi:hypothetical protein
MTSFRQFEANRANARKSTGPADAEDYQAFEAAIIADYDAGSAVERELVLRLARLLWRLRCAATMESGPKVKSGEV